MCTATILWRTNGPLGYVWVRPGDSNPRSYAYWFRVLPLYYVSILKSVAKVYLIRFTHMANPQQHMAKEYYTHHNNMLAHNDLAAVIIDLHYSHSPGVTTILPVYENK